MFLLATWSLTGHAQAEPWQSVRSEDGLRMETRRVAGERFDELRISTSLNVSPEAIADYLVGKYLDQKNKNIRRTFVQRGRELTIWSDVLSAPMISERCYSMRFERLALANGEIRVKFASLDYIGKTPKADCIALRTRGEWIMTPTAAGSRLTYVSLTDIGGNVPTMLVRRSLSSAAVSSVRKVIAGSSGLTLPRGLGD
ncbi:MAG: hypothetical protein ACREP7_13775 [Lysobacter sp.]